MNEIAYFEDSSFNKLMNQIEEWRHNYSKNSDRNVNPLSISHTVDRESFKHLDDTVVYSAILVYEFKKK